MLDNNLDVAGIVTEYFNDSVRTDNGAHCAARAAGVVCFRRKITHAVRVFGDNDYLFWAHRHAQAAALASFGVNNDFTSHSYIAYIVFNFSFTEEFQYTVRIVMGPDVPVKLKRLLFDTTERTPFMQKHLGLKSKIFMVLIEHDIPAISNVFGIKADQRQRIIEPHSEKLLATDQIQGRKVVHTL